MKEPTFPPRLSQSSSDARLVDALDVAKSYDPAEPCLERALARFEATRSPAVAPPAGLRLGDGRPMFSLKAGAVVVLAVVLGAGWMLQRSASDAPAPAVVASPAKTSADEVVSPATTAPGAAKTVRVDELPTAMAAAATGEKPALRPRPTPSASAVATTASFDDELALVEAARTSLATGNAAGCLSQLDRYDRQIHGGVFEREVAVMRIEALLARGEGPPARVLGEAFLARSPDSPYADRVRSLLTKAAAQPPAAP